MLQNAPLPLLTHTPSNPRMKVQYPSVIGPYHTQYDNKIHYQLLVFYRSHVYNDKVNLIQPTFVLRKKSIISCNCIVIINLVMIGMKSYLNI